MGTCLTVAREDHPDRPMRGRRVRRTMGLPTIRGVSMFVRRPTGLASLALFALALGACGDDSDTQSTNSSGAKAPATVDSSQVEQGIEQDLSTSTVEVTGASCPSDVEKQKGATFTCSVKLSNGA